MAGVYFLQPFMFASQHVCARLPIMCIFFARMCICLVCLRDATGLPAMKFVSYVSSD